MPVGSASGLREFDVSAFESIQRPLGSPNLFAWFHLPARTSKNFYLSSE
jgi:hypothetical protein